MSSIFHLNLSHVVRMESEGGRASDSPRRAGVRASLCCADIGVAVKPALASLPGDAAPRAQRPLRGEGASQGLTEQEPGRELREHLQHEVTSISHLFSPTNSPQGWECGLRRRSE